MFIHLIEEIRAVVEGGGSRGRKASRQAATAGEYAARATGTHKDGAKPPWPFPSSKSRKLQRSSAKMMTQLGDQETKRFTRKGVASGQ